MSNPLNPLDWVRTAQDWFRKTEKSSGFRSYLIFLLIHSSLAVIALQIFNNIPEMQEFVINSLYISYGAFVLLFVFKSIQDPSFCRSERHVETVKRIELMEQKGDRAPKVIQTGKVELTSDPERKQLSS